MKRGKQEPKPFDRLKDLAGRLVKVPKEEIDKKMDDYQNEKEIKAKLRE